MDKQNIIKKAWDIAQSWTSEDERNELIDLARDVHDNGLIVEIGGLYGGMTCILGLSNPQARIIVIDDFSWDPSKLGASPKLLLNNCERAGVTNVRVIKGDSRETGKTWNEPIELLWIDGGHSYEFVKSDLDRFGPHAKRIALHDWENPFWLTIKEAVMDFLSEHPEWVIGHAVDSVVVLERIGEHEPQMSEM